VTDEPDRVGRPADEVDSALSETEESVDDGSLRDALDALTRIDPTDRWVELLAAAILAFATVASAWSASGHQLERGPSRRVRGSRGGESRIGASIRLGRHRARD